MRTDRVRPLVLRWLPIPPGSRDGPELAHPRLLLRDRSGLRNRCAGGGEENLVDSRRGGLGTMGAEDKNLAVANIRRKNIQRDFLGKLSVYLCFGIRGVTQTRHK